MLNLTRDTTCDINFRMYSYTCLTNLSIMVYPTSIYSSTTCTYFAMKFFSEFEEKIETFLATYTITTSNYDRSTLQIVLGCFYMTVDNFHNKVSLWYIFSNIRVNDFAFSLAIVDSLLHNARAYCSHLWTVVWVNNSSYDITTESRTNLI